MDQLVSFTLWFVKYYVAPMIANASPLLVRGRIPIDLNHVFIDGKPLLGRNKTFEGFFIGVYMGFSASIIVSMIFNDLGLMFLGFGSTISALLGDLFGSFIKRRFDIASGDPLPLLDQLDFALFSTLYYILLGVKGFYEYPLYIVFSLILILLLHVLTNNIAYYIGVKDKRW